jgi:ComF family protein
MGILDLLFPHPCIYCGSFVKTDRFGLCRKCAVSLPMKLNHRRNTTYLFEYDKRIASLLKTSKYAGKPYYVRMLATLMGKLMYDMGCSYDIVTFVPMHRKSFISRGYNQSKVAARAVSEELGVPLCEGAIFKIKGNKKQAGLGKAERKTNVRGVYKADGGTVNGKRILLVDDIMTTGSTLDECEKELRYAGATEVTRAVIAYTPVGRKR